MCGRKKGGQNRDHYLEDPLYVRVQSLSCVQLFTKTWTLARHAPLAIGFPRQEHWSGLPFLSPGGRPASPALAGEFFTSKTPREAPGRTSKTLERHSLCVLSKDGCPYIHMFAVCGSF